MASLHGESQGSHQTVPVPSRRQQHATGALQSDHTGTMAGMDKRNYKLPSGIPPVIKHCIFGNSEIPTICRFIARKFIYKWEIFPVLCWHWTIPALPWRNQSMPHSNWIVFQLSKQTERIKGELFQSKRMVYSWYLIAVYSCISDSCIFAYGKWYMPICTLLISDSCI